jgi:hypothetical protein
MGIELISDGWLMIDDYYIQWIGLGENLGTPHI